MNHWTDIITKIFDRSFATRWDGNCTGWTNELALYHVVADILIFLAYMAIPALLIYLVKKRKDIPFDALFLLFAIFIVGCGLTHLMGATTVFYPYYYLDFWVKAITALASIATAAVFVKLLPAVIGMINPVEANKQLVEANEKIEKQNTQLLETEKQLTSTNAELSQFAYIASHDLKAPLRGIAHVANWIVEDVGDKITEDTKKHISLMLNRILRMNNLIDGILQYSRIGRLNVEETTLNLNDIIAEILDAIDKKQFTFDLADLPQLTGNKAVVTQLFQNLITNGIKHHPRDNGHIIVSFRDVGDKYEFSVKDDGDGIDPVFFRKLFVPFQTLKPKDEVESTGIGLALCKKIVELAGGKIWIESEVGHGANFKFTWPK